jgi:hypothetical protein
MKRNYMKPMERCRNWLVFAFIMLFAISGFSQVRQEVEANRDYAKVECGVNDITTPGGIAPVFASGNPEPNCAQIIHRVKIDPPTPGTYNLPNGGTLTISLRTGPCGEVLDWVASPGVEIYEMVVKGGPNANIYYYPTPIPYDNNLHTPVGPSGYYGVSHIDFCYDLCAATGVQSCSNQEHYLFWWR